MPRAADPALTERRKQEILAAAAACFVRSGFHQSNMQAICAASGLSPGGLYRYFPSKDAIILAIAEKQRSAHQDLAAALSAGGSALTTLLSASVRLAEGASDPEQARLALEAMAEAGRNPAVGETFRAQDRQLVDAMTAAFERGQANGEITNSQSPAELVDVTLALFDGLVARAAAGLKMEAQSITAGLQSSLRALLSS